MKKFCLNLAALLSFITMAAFAEGSVTIKKIEVPKEFLADGGVFHLTTGHIFKFFCDPESPLVSARYRVDKNCKPIPTTDFQMDRGYGKQLDVLSLGGVAIGRGFESDLEDGGVYAVVLSDYKPGPNKKGGTIEVKIVRVHDEV